MIDINDTNFISRFETSEATVGIVGHGYVGQAVEYFFKKTDMQVLVHDKAKPEFKTLEEVVDNAEVIFVCVPTPMNMKDGSCFTGIVIGVLKDIKRIAEERGRSLDSFVCVVKSTVPPLFTLDMQEELKPMRITFSPEFLTEANSFKDFEKQNRIIVGGDEDDANTVLKYFQSVVPERAANQEVLLIQTDSTTAELVKLFANGILATKVMFCNEMYKLCQSLKVDYEDVRVMACLDSRIGSGHTKVPGPDGNLGYGGHCFPKDLMSLAWVMALHGVDEKVITAVVERNLELRPPEARDWEKMQGRAVIDGQ